MERHLIRTLGGNHGQRGFALVVGLVLLVVMSLLAVTGVRSTILQERMAGNMHDRNLAFQAAEAALRHGEMNVDALAVVSPRTEAYDPEAWVAYFKDNGYGNSLPDEGDDWAVAAMPFFEVEELPPPPQEHLEADMALPEQGVYRVTALGAGGRDDTIVILQSTFRR